jgi:uncharacterized protein
MSVMLVPNPVVFSVLDEKFCVAKLPADAALTLPAQGGSLFAVARTPEELSIVCEEAQAPSGAEIERNWRALKVQGPLEFSLKGVLVSLLQPLAEAEISVFAVSTYNTDYLLVPQYHLANALKALELAGHRITPL